MTERVERLTNLLALLLETPEPLTLVQITSELGGQYPDSERARRAAFERDKAALRDLGRRRMPIVPFLPRRHVLNRALGSARSLLMGGLVGR